MDSKRPLNQGKAPVTLVHEGLDAVDGVTRMTKRDDTNLWLTKNFKAQVSEFFGARTNGYL